MLTREDLRGIMEEVAAATKTEFKPTEQLKDKAVGNALSGFAKGCRREEIVGLYDATVFGNGKRGILLAVDGIYSHEFPSFDRQTNGVSKLPLDGVCSFEKGGTNNAFLTVRYQDGSEIVVYAGNVYDKPVLGILEAVIAKTSANAAASAPAPKATGKAPTAKPVAVSQPKEEAAPAQTAPVEEVPAVEPVAVLQPKKETAPAQAASVEKGSGAQPVEIPEEINFDALCDEILAQADATVELPVPAKVVAEASPAVETVSEKQKAEAAYRMGSKLYLEGKEQEALKPLLVAANLGQLDAQLLCALIYSEEYTDEDDAQALYWYQKAAEQGSDRAQYCCGVMYENGEGTVSDPAKALYWYLKAAQKGHDRAQFRCGVLYEDGLGTDMDKEEAMRWYLKSAKQGVCEAQVICGINYMKGEGVKKDWDKAKFWLEQAAAQEDESAQNLLRTYFK